MTPSGKVVIWGHWIVGLFAAAITVESIWGIVGNTVSMERGARFGPQVLTADSQFAVLGMICALCAWGILRWRPWGHVLALGIFTFELFVGALALLAGNSGPLYPLVACLILSWLVLPSVRSAYWRRVQATCPLWKSIRPKHDIIWTQTSRELPESYGAG